MLQSIDFKFSLTQSMQWSRSRRLEASTTSIGGLRQWRMNCRRCCLIERRQPGIVLLNALLPRSSAHLLSSSYHIEHGECTQEYATGRRALMASHLLNLDAEPIDVKKRITVTVERICVKASIERVWRRLCG